MRLLGIDTSTKYAGVAVIEDGRLIAQSIMEFKAAHSEKLLPEIAHVIETMKIPIETIDYYSVTVGPGSFTGLRVAVSTLKGLSFVTQKKVIPVSTLEGIAWGVPYCKYQICPILDARKKEVFAALFRWNDNEIQRIKEDSVINIEALAEWIKEDTLFVGSGVELYKEKLIEKFGGKALFLNSIYSVPNPAIVAFIASKRIEKAIHAKDLKPVYLRKSEAEIKFG
ncbi:tRNA (adenosine(37)-N6)-threonylcarbamoyltransferase complex dimerization subunit type 1 TsaB [Thermodesulfovibrio sp. TK110]